jgi:hypothetical protein
MEPTDPAEVARTIYRQANDGTALGAGELGDGATMSAYCECRDGCASTIPLTVAEYRRVRAIGAFVVLPGHAGAGGEVLLEDRDTYLVVADPLRIHDRLPPLPGG